MSNRSQSRPADTSDLALRLRALDVGMWDYDIDADALQCDDRWYALLDLKPGSVKSVDDFKRFIHPADVEIATRVDLDEVAAMVAGDHRYHVDFRVIRTDGTTRRWRSVACVIVDRQSGHKRAVGCVTDTTDIQSLAAVPVFAGDLAGDAMDRPVPDDQASARPGEPLSIREIECLRWVSLGKTAWETAMIMSRSRRTIEFHLLNAVRKLGAINKVHAAVIAVRQGLI